VLLFVFYCRCNRGLTRSVCGTVVASGLPGEIGLRGRQVLYTAVDEDGVLSSVCVSTRKYLDYDYD